MEVGQPGKNKWREFGRHWAVVFVLAIAAGFVIWAMLEAGPIIRAWQERRSISAAQKQLENQYKNDKYGGKTPEETFDMFIAALEKGDVDLASKYFVLNKQEQWRKTLAEYSSEDLLIDLAYELKNTKNIWTKIKTSDPNIAQYESSTVVENDTSVTLNNGNKVTLPKGDYANVTIFEKKPSGVWKISTI